MHINSGEMRIIRNKILPFGHYVAINLFGVIFVKGDFTIPPHLLNHEQIHSQQMRELLWVFFYLIYVAEWLFRLVQHGGDMHKAYHAISFEREAYAHQHNLHYLASRKSFAQWR